MGIFIASKKTAPALIANMHQSFTAFSIVITMKAIVKARMPISSLSKETSNSTEDVCG
jgi:hypothetical protein